MRLDDSRYVRLKNARPEKPFSGPKKIIIIKLSIFYFLNPYEPKIIERMHEDIFSSSN